MHCETQAPKVRGVPATGESRRSSRVQIPSSAPLFLEQALNPWRRTQDANAHILPSEMNSRTVSLMEFRRSILLTVLMLMVVPMGAPRVFVPSSGDGPTFSDYGGFYIDYTGSSGSVWLAATVKDADGVQTVIGGVSNISGLEWHNVTMSASGAIQDRYYGNYDVSLPEDGHTYEFLVKYYAEDTLGNWNTTNITHEYLTNLGLWRSPSTMFTVVGILAGTFAVVLALIVVIRRRNS
jgi:hypothetical protein